MEMENEFMYEFFAYLVNNELSNTLVVILEHWALHSHTGIPRITRRLGTGKPSVIEIRVIQGSKFIHIEFF